jgi:2',3'-cyclic-nucleotide 2'-phosphodiesterase (5'-nucleotidase family)
MFQKILLPLFSFVALISCTPQQQITSTFKYQGYQIEKQNKADESILKMLAPYSDSINKTMNKVIGFSTTGLTKKQPESELGNFMTDCMKEMAQQKFGKKVDAAFVNYGGIRSYLPKGDITVGRIYELMPFDNLIVLQEVNGSVLKSFLAKVAERGGWPVSGMSYQIKEKHPQNILIDGKPIDDNAIYIIANTDYIALQGGDDCSMLKGLPTVNIGYLFRDALIEYVQQVTKKGNPIESKIEGRVTY